MALLRCPRCHLPVPSNSLEPFNCFSCHALLQVARPDGGEPTVRALEHDTRATAQVDVRALEDWIRRKGPG